MSRKSWLHYIVPRLSLQPVRRGVIDPVELDDDELETLVQNIAPDFLAVQVILREYDRRHNRLHLV